ncbi:MAG: 50S ribosomal protein L11 methyltransferase [Ignavibacteria bacterium]|nr:50S ribosomal protein L11 methyltransferase [Ignavibacteria bacterium]
MKSYTQYTITVNPRNNELISGMMWQFDLDGITEFDDGIKLFIESAKSISEEDITSVLEYARGEGLINEYYIQREIVEDKNWNEDYEKNVKVIEVTERIVIKPSFKEYQSGSGKIVITIDPKMSFGTGEHETTKLMIRMIEKYVSKNDFVLDVGSGTGVLAISSVLLGARKSIGIDNDEWCLMNGKENVTMNSLDDKVEIRRAELHQIVEKDFDLILANINKHILIDIVPYLKAKIKETGKLVVSGLLKSDFEDIIDKFALYNFVMIEKTELGDWISIAFTVSTSH